MSAYVETVARWPRERALPDVVRHAGCRPVTATSLVEVATLALLPLLPRAFELAPAEVSQHVDPATQLGRLLAAGRSYDTAEGATCLGRWLSGVGLSTAEAERYRVPNRPDERVTLDYVCRLILLFRRAGELSTVKLAFCWCPAAQALTAVPRKAITDRCVTGGLTVALVTRRHR